MDSIKPKNKRKIWLVTILGVLVAIYGAACLYIYLNQVELTFKPRKHVDEEEREIADSIKAKLEFDAVNLTVGNGDQKGEVHGYWIPAKRKNAPTLLYLHGQDATIDKNLEHTYMLHDLGYNVMLIDYRGFGKSYGDTQPSEDKVYEDADAAWQYILDNKESDPGRIFIFGHSLGGAIAIELATRKDGSSIDGSREDIAGGLITVCTFTSILDMSKLKYNGMLRLLPMRLLLSEHLDSLNKIGDVGIPKLFIHGEKDEKVPYQMSKALFDEATGEKHFRLLPDCPHSDFKQSDLKTMGSEIRKFVESYSNGPPATSDDARD